MKQISLWAKRNVWPARILIIFFHIILSIIAIYWGALSFNAGFYLNEGWLYVLALAYFSHYFIYPTKVSKTFLKNTYPVRKLLHTTMAVCSFMLVFTFVNVNMQPQQTGYAFAAVPLPVTIGNKGYKNPEAERLMTAWKNGELKKFTKKDRQVLKEELKYQVKSYKDANTSSRKKEGGNAGLIILTILGALILFSVVASLSCSLGCTGNEGAAIIVLVLGTALIIFGVVRIIRGITKKKQASLQNKKTEQPSA